MRHLERLHTAFQILRHRGLGYLWYLVSGYFIPKTAYHLLSSNSPRRLKQVAKALIAAILAGAFALSSSFVGVLTGGLILVIVVLAAVGMLLVLQRVRFYLKWQYAQRRLDQIRGSYNEKTFTHLSQLPISGDTRQAIEVSRQSSPHRELVIGKIDNDLRVLGIYGEIPILPPVSEADFSPRPRFHLDIVLIEDSVLVRKNFRGDRRNFLNEWFNLVLLYGKANVPAIFRVDVHETIIYKNLIRGPIVRDLLVRAGAKIMHMQTDNDPELAGLSKAERLNRIVARGTEVVPECLSEHFLLEMEHQINIIHSCGITGVTPTFGNVIVESEHGRPYFIDFEGAFFRATQAALFHFQRDRDREKYNQRFQRNILTEATARQAIQQQLAKAKNWYAPIDFGRGWAMNGFWSIGSGTGRWDVIQAKISPYVINRRVLDLGSNNGIMPIMMLRAGACKVIGLELSPEYFEAAKLIHRIFEWRDMRAYDFQMHNCNMLEILDCDWSPIDIVTAFCSLYYLTEEDMIRVVRRAADLAPVMILQANTATRREAAQEKSKKASVEFMQQLLRENGFPHVEIFAPYDYGRPVLIGQRT